MSPKKCIKKAIQSLRSGEYGLSCGHFCLAFRTAANSGAHTQRLLDRWRPTFLYALQRHIHFLETVHADRNALLTAFDEAATALPDCADIHYHKGIYFYRNGLLSEAVTSFLLSLKLDPNFNLSHLCLENIKSSSMARWHYIMINDIKRNSAFKEAIGHAIRRGYNSVLDVGSGSGLLSLYSVQSGADQVYACEVSQMLYHLCRDVLQTNGVDQRVILFNEMSTNLEIPRMIEHKVKLIVTEIFDAALFGEHVLTTLQSALKNLLDSSNGLVLPIRAKVFGILIESQELRNSFSLVKRRFGNTVIPEETTICINFDDFKYTTTNLTKVDKKFLSDKFEIIDIDFNDVSQIDRVLQSDFVLDIVVQCSSFGRLDAIGVWFDLNLIDDIHISTEPPSKLIGWEQAVYPTSASPLTTAPDTKLLLRFSLSEDFLKLIDLRTMKDISLVDRNAVHLSAETIKYLNANDYHEKYIKAIEEVIESTNINNIINFVHLPIAAINFIDFDSLREIIIIKDETKTKECIDVINVSNRKTNNKLVFLEFDKLLAENVIHGSNLTVLDVLEPTGLIASNVLDKMAYLSLYLPVSSHLIPSKIVIKGSFIQSTDLLMRSRLISDDSVHGFRIKDLLNIFETEILQDIDHRKLEMSHLSRSFKLLELDLETTFGSRNEIDLEPKSQCIADIAKNGDLDALLYWYDIHLTHQIVICSLDIGPDWHSSAFVLKQSVPVTTDNRISFECMFTNGFLRIKDLKIL